MAGFMAYSFFRTREAGAVRTAPPPPQLKTLLELRATATREGWSDLGCGEQLPGSDLQPPPPPSYRHAGAESEPQEPRLTSR